MWPTPTPIPTPSGAPLLSLDPNTISFDFTSWILQGWNLFDSNPVATVVFVGLVLLVIYLGVQSIRIHLEDL